MKRTALLVAASALALAACSDQAPTGATPGAVSVPRRDPALDIRAGTDGPHVAGRLLARFRADADAETVAAAHGATVSRELALDGVLLLEVAKGQEERVAAELAADPAVEWAEPDYVIQALPCEVGQCAETSDQFIGYKWDLHNPGEIRVGGTTLARTGAVDADIDWQEMYDYLGPSFSGSATIGIIDTGIRRTHTDIAGKLVAERNFVTTDPAQRGNADDDNSHGTHVAGIAAALAHNGRGVAGVGYGPNIKLMALKACTAAGSCPQSATAEAIVWATDNGANVLNLSLTGFGSATAGSALQRNALQYAAARNVLAVCSTGNDARKTNPAVNNPVYTGGIGFPARFNECLAVGATNWADDWAGYSNHGPGIDVSAPGGDGSPAGAVSQVLSLSFSSNTSYSWKSGTSMAAPQVAGLAAVLYAMGITDRQAIRNRIEQTADDLGPAGWDEKFGWGRINAYRAVTGKDPFAPPTADAGGAYAGTEGAPVQFDGRASADPNGKPLTFAWSFGDGRTSTEAAPAHAYADDGEYTVTLTVSDASGRSSTATTVARVANAAPEVGVSLSASALASGASTTLAGTFSDAGVNDAPWGWTASWGNGVSTGAAATQSAGIEASRRFCAEGTYTVRLSVTDKDGATGSAAAQVTVSALPVALSGPGSFNRESAGKLPVAILSTAALDAGSIDVATARLGGAAVARRSNGSPMASREDRNGDGRADLVLHFERPEIQLGDNRMAFEGTLNDGCREVRGTLLIRIH